MIMSSTDMSMGSTKAATKWISRFAEIEDMTPEERTVLIQSFADDMVATFLLIAELEERGILHAENTRDIDLVARIINDTAVNRAIMLEAKNRVLEDEMKIMRVQNDRIKTELARAFSSGLVENPGSARNSHSQSSGPSSEQRQVFEAQTAQWVECGSSRSTSKSSSEMDLDARPKTRSIG